MFKSGFVSIIGRPNCGKSTLLNQLLGEKVSIVSERPQTTRHNIQGILTLAEGQIVFKDTPGIHKPEFELNRRMMHLLYDALEGVDLLLALVDASTTFGAGDQFVIELLHKQKLPVFLLLNKIDLLQKERLLPLISFYAKKHAFSEIIPISALKKDNLDLLVKLVLQHLPEGPAFFPDDHYTDKHERFLAGELVREKVLRHTREELPFSIAVVVNRFQERNDEFVFLACDIVVEKKSQRKIVIGSHGQMLKQIGTEAREDIEKLLGKRAYLELFVKVQPNWRNDPQFLDSIEISRSNG